MQNDSFMYTALTSSKIGCNEQCLLRFDTIHVTKLVEWGVNMTIVSGIDCSVRLLGLFHYPEVVIPVLILCPRCTWTNDQVWWSVISSLPYTISCTQPPPLESVISLQAYTSQLVGLSAATQLNLMTMINQGTFIKCTMHDFVDLSSISGHIFMMIGK